MGRELRLEAVMDDVDRILELDQDSPEKAAKRLRRLDQKLEWLLEASRVDESRWRKLNKAVASVRSAAAEMFQSLGSARRDVQLRQDWLRFARRDFMALKEELLALREQLVGDADFFRLACLRDQIGKLAGTRPERLFQELHEAGFLSERTWVLLMSYPGSGEEWLRDGEVSKQISRISSWLLELQEARKGRRGQGRGPPQGDAPDDLQGER
jgi:hypothetical protein